MQDVLVATARGADGPERIDEQYSERTFCEFGPLFGRNVELRFADAACGAFPNPLLTIPLQRRPPCNLVDFEERVFGGTMHSAQTWFMESEEQLVAEIDAVTSSLVWDHQS